MADQQCELIQADREMALEEKRQQMRELGAHELLQQLDTVYGNLRQSSWFKPDSDFSVGYVDRVADDVKAAMAALGVGGEKLESVRIVTTLHEEVSARLRPFPDGSGLVIVADGLIGTCSSYSHYIALSGHRWLDWRSLRASVKTRMYENPDVLTGMLRYSTTNQRVAGATTQLDVRLGPRGRQTAWHLSEQAYRFVIGHEIAHHVLGHSPAASSFAPDEDLSACSENERRERDADLLAFRAVRQAGLMQNDGVLRAAVAVQLAETGVLIAMLALYLTEQALFVRRGCTHPPAATRAAWLLKELGARRQKSLQRLLRIPREATAAAADMSESARPFSWETLQAAPVRSHMPPSHMDAIGWLDALQCLPGRAHVYLLEEAGAGWLGEGARLAAAGKPAAALRHWGVEEDTVDVVCDAERALAFFTLKEHIAGSFTARGVADDLVLPYSVSAATLAASALRPRGG
ncbi:hypothetical protein [Streptomyces sp. NPDC090022]|uniref:hypothetical protein n=1 Tax=Streptomyces sp. NPDC090022 TaxID=3365920 RepID=UPI0038068BEA